MNRDCPMHSGGSRLRLATVPPPDRGQRSLTTIGHRRVRRRCRSRRRRRIEKEPADYDACASPGACPGCCGRDRVGPVKTVLPRNWLTTTCQAGALQPLQVCAWKQVTNHSPVFHHSRGRMLDRESGWFEPECHFPVAPCLNCSRWSLARQRSLPLSSS